MAIPLTASPAPAVNYDDMLTGDSSHFKSGIGDWTNSGGTLTYDTTIAYMWPSNNTGSAKFVTTAQDQYIEVPVAGTFKAGEIYVAMVVVTQEEETACDVEVRLGVQGTDTDYCRVNTYTGKSQWNGGRPWCVMVRWEPSTDRTGVTLRLHRTETSGTGTWHVSHAKVFRSLPMGIVPILGLPSTNAAPPGSSPGFTTYGTAVNGDVSLGVGAASGNGPQLQFGGGWASVGLTSYDTGLPYNSFYVGKGGADVQAEGDGSTPGDLADLGMSIEVGEDYVGLYISEKDSDTVQFYSDYSAAYMMQLRNRGTGKGWAVSDDGTVNAEIAAYFDHVLRVSGSLSVATDVADYLQLSRKAIIDEVHAHVGTAPTGQALIVDVNDDGTTIFTTQGNRPQIADGTNDDTSGEPDGGTAVAAGSIITVDVDQVGSGTAGSDLYVSIRGRYIW